MIIRRIAIAVLGLLWTACLLYGQEPVARFVVLPLHGSGIDSVAIQTAESILRTEISKLSSMDLVSARRTLDAAGGTPCAESDCALEIGRKLDATEVLGCRLSALGEKIIVQFFVVSVPEHKEVLVDQATASYVEDLDLVMKRIARSAVDRKPIGKSAEVGNIVASETVEPLRRASRKNFGFSFGYLYPQSGYDGGDRSFTVHAQFDYELENYAVGMLFGVREGWAMNLYGEALLSPTDFCPYVGGAFGFHWITHNDHPQYNLQGNVIRQPGKGDGFEITGNAGLRVLHTYNFQMIFNIEYIYTLNDFDDKAVVFTIGIL